MNICLVHTLTFSLSYKIPLMEILHTLWAHHVIYKAALTNYLCARESDTAFITEFILLLLLSTLTIYNRVQLLNATQLFRVFCFYVYKPRFIYFLNQSYISKLENKQYSTPDHLTSHNIYINKSQNKLLYITISYYPC